MPTSTSAFPCTRWESWTRRCPTTRTAIELDPSHAPAQFSLANVLRLRGKPEEALVHFQKAVDLLPTDPNPLNGLAWELATCAEPRLRDPAQAVDLAKKVVDLSLKQGDDRDKPGRDRLGNYWNTLGVAHYRAGQLDEAHCRPPEVPGHR